MKPAAKLLNFARLPAARRRKILEYAAAGWWPEFSDYVSNTNLDPSCRGRRDVHRIEQMWILIPRAAFAGVPKQAEGRNVIPLSRFR